MGETGSPQPRRSLREIEREEDRQGIPGYGQPPEEVRTTHLEGAPEDDRGKAPAPPEKR